MLTQYFFSCVHVRFYFSLPLIFTLVAAGISHCLTAALNFLFFFLQNSSLLFSVTHSSSFSVIHVSVNIKNNVEKDTTLLLFFLSKKSGRPCDFFPNKLTLSCVCWLNYFTLECLWCGRMVGRSGSRCTVTWLPNFLGWVVYHIFLPMVLCCALRARAPL